MPCFEEFKIEECWGCKKRPIFINKWILFFSSFFVANQVQISCLISWSSELNGCGFLQLCQEQNTTSNNRSDVGCTGTPFGISQFNPLRVLCYWVMKSFMIHLRFYSCGAPSTGWIINKWIHANEEPEKRLIHKSISYLQSVRLDFGVSHYIFKYVCGARRARP
jgi:hypothetical protein